MQKRCRRSILVVAAVLLLVEAAEGVVLATVTLNPTFAVQGDLGPQPLSFRSIV